MDGTIEELFLTAFEGLLFRYTETEEILIAWEMQGAPPSVLPVGVSLTADHTFAQLLESTRNACRRGDDRGSVPVETLSGVLRDLRQCDYDDFFPIRFRASIREDLSAWPPETDLAGELSLCVAISRDQIHIRFRYNANRYQPCFMEALADHYCRFLESAAEQPMAALIDLDMTTPEELARLLAWSSGPEASRVPNLYHVRFQEYVDKNPDKEAVVYPGGVLTYGELDSLANQAAHHFQSLGVGPNVPVAICLHRCLELVIAYIGIVKAGGAIFLLDPSAPAERIRAELNAISPAFVLTQAPLHQNLAGFNWPVICYEEIRTQLANQKKTAPVNHVALDNTAFLIATSGSTGLPKIIRTQLGHYRPGIGYERPELAPPSPDDRHLLKTDSGTGFTHAEILRPLTWGGTLYIAPEGLEYDPPGLASYIREHQISCLLAAPSQLSALLDAESLANCDSLRVVECIGEIVPSDLKQRFFAKLKQSSLIVSYGCSEAPSATGRVCSPIYDDPAIVDVGRPAPLMEVFVLDSRQRLSPVGVPGEIYLGGELSGEYMNDPAGTAERLVPHVFSRTPSARLFRTGDLGRWLPKGTLEVLKRRDSQVKIRGYRIEIGEIETVLAQHSGVSRCAVVVREDRRGDRQIVAYWIAQGKTKATTSTLRQHLLRSLPEYMVPSFFVRLDSMPLTPNGKLDRNALPAPDACRPDLDTPYVAPRSPIEEALASIWCEVLRLRDVGVQDNFFELGGHSLLATQVVSRLKKGFDLEIPLRSIFEYSTIEALAIAIIQSQDEVRNPAELALLLAELEKSEH